jgi:hypothetical protein
MRSFSLRRSALAVTALLALIAVPLAQAPVAGAADAPPSSVIVTDPTGDTMRNDAVVDEPTADITAASVRYQNDFVTFTMKLVKGDGLADPESLLYWIITTSSQSCCENVVSLKKGLNGLQIVMGDNANAPIDSSDPTQTCTKSSLSHDIGSGSYIASVHASCISPDALPSFM